MAIYSNENMTKMKLSHLEYPHLVQNREIYAVYSISVFSNIAITRDCVAVQKCMNRIRGCNMILEVRVPCDRGT